MTGNGMNYRSLMIAEEAPYSLLVMRAHRREGVDKMIVWVLKSLLHTYICRPHYDTYHIYPGRQVPGSLHTQKQRRQLLHSDAMDP